VFYFRCFDGDGKVQADRLALAIEAAFKGLLEEPTKEWVLHDPDPDQRERTSGKNVAAASQAMQQRRRDQGDQTVVLLRKTQREAPETPEGAIEEHPDGNAAAPETLAIERTTAAAHSADRAGGTPADLDSESTDEFRRIRVGPAHLFLW